MKGLVLMRHHSRVFHARAIVPAREHAVTAVSASAIVGELLARSISLTAGVSLVILLLAGLFSTAP
jgi:hypothetical protein